MKTASVLAQLFSMWGKNESFRFENTFNVYVISHHYVVDDI